MVPQTIMQVGKYMAGFPILLRNKLDGTCIRRYPTKRMLTAVCCEISIDDSEHSFLKLHGPDIVLPLNSNHLPYRPDEQLQYYSKAIRTPVTCNTPTTS